MLENNLLVKKFKELSEKNERGLICYALPGYPNYKFNKNGNSNILNNDDTTLQIVSTMVEAGNSFL